MVRLVKLMLVIQGFLLSCNGTEEAPDEVVELVYSERVVRQRIKRRFDLLSARVPLKEKWAIEQVWRNAMGYTFIARMPKDGERGIRRLKVRKEGRLQRGDGTGIDQSSRGVHHLEDGFWIVDIFSSLGKYRNSVAVPRTMSGRRILQHLPIASPLGEDIDRIKLTPAEEHHWRGFMPDLILNGGYGKLFVRNLETQEGKDSLQVVGKKYNIEEVDGFILAGRREGAQAFRHIFTQGGEYSLSVLVYGEQALEPLALLAVTGLRAVGKEQD